MRILYGVAGEGMGTRLGAQSFWNTCWSSGHEVKIVVSGRAHDFLKERFAQHQHVVVEEIHGITLRYFENKVSRAESLFWNLKNSPQGVTKNIKVYRKVAEEKFRPALVISDFESWAALYGLRQGIPVVSIDNIQAVNRLKHDKSIRKGKGFDFRVARLAVKIKVPRSLSLSDYEFFLSPGEKEVYDAGSTHPARRGSSCGPQTGRSCRRLPTRYRRKELLAILRKFSVEFRVYGSAKERRIDNVVFLPFSGAGFLEDLRTARAVIAGGGFSLMSEAVSLGVPILSIPIEGQFEQDLTPAICSSSATAPGHANSGSGQSVHSWIERTSTQNPCHNMNGKETGCCLNASMNSSSGSPGKETSKGA